MKDGLTFESVDWIKQIGPSVWVGIIQSVEEKDKKVKGEEFPLSVWLSDLGHWSSLPRD